MIIHGLADLVAEREKVLPGGYQIIFRLPRITLEVGKLGLQAFPAGVYLYSGSAMRGVRQRVLRHLRKEKRKHWHIDCVLEAATVVGVRYVRSAEPVECRLHREAVEVLGATEPVPGFGATDCRCSTHLARLPRPLAARTILRRLEATRT